MATWGELGLFTYGELVEMGLTYGDLNDLTIEQLIKIAEIRLDRFKKTKSAPVLSSDTIELLNRINSNLELLVPTDKPKPSQKWANDRIVSLFDKLLELAAVWAITHPSELYQLLCDMVSALSKLMQK